jgi:hypothetical protein
MCSRFWMRGLGWRRFTTAMLDPDYLTGFSNGIRAKYLKPGQTERLPGRLGLDRGVGVGDEPGRGLFRDG